MDHTFRKQLNNVASHVGLLFLFAMEVHAIPVNVSRWLYNVPLCWYVGVQEMLWNGFVKECHHDSSNMIDNIISQKPNRESPSDNNGTSLTLADTLQLIVGLLSLMCAVVTAIWGPCFLRSQRGGPGAINLAVGIMMRE